MLWSMISEQTSLTNAALEWYAKFHTMIGVSHDTVNRVYAHAPPDELLVGLEEKLLFDDVLAEDDRPAAILAMIAQAAAFMTSSTANVLTGEPWTFKAMYATPHHRIWCARYEDKNTSQFEDDFLAVFGVVAGATTTAQASTMIKQYFIGIQP
jgi:hypothetical protein